MLTSETGTAVAAVDVAGEDDADAADASTAAAVAGSAKTLEEVHAGSWQASPDYWAAVHRSPGQRQDWQQPAALPRSKEDHWRDRRHPPMESQEDLFDRDLLGLEPEPELEPR